MLEAWFWFAYVFWTQHEEVVHTPYANPANQPGSTQSMSSPRDPSCAGKAASQWSGSSRFARLDVEDALIEDVRIN